MSDTSIQAFLDQFETTKKNIESWPGWMKETAKVATASFPKSEPDSVTVQPAETHAGKQAK
jgi:hypothetical protein